MAKIFRYDDVPVVEISSGKIKGYFFDKTYVFKGIPYAQAKRFQAPEEVTPWEGVRETASYGMVSPMLHQDNPQGELFVPHRYWPQDENCQNLNIWTKNLNNDVKKPVLVWLHGGGFSMGSSIEQIAYDGANMCDLGDVVVVSINHRLNILGYLDLSPFGEKYANSANAGHADMVAALKWINKNISAFGGDPDNVTVFGQSGGGMKCTGLMQIPEANGLFHKAIIMSGVSDGKLIPSPKGDGKQIVEAMLDELGIPHTEAEKLETVPYYELAKAYNAVSPAIAKEGGYVGNAPMQNDWYCGEPLITGFTEHAKTIPFMVGTVFGEFMFMPLPFDKTKITDEEMENTLGDKFGERANEVIAEYKKAYPGKKIIDILALDRIFRKPTRDLAILAAKEGKAPAYLYNFTLEFPYRSNKIAWHCSDIPFFFHNTEKVEVCNIAGVSDDLERSIFNSVIRFAYSGDPNNEYIPSWEAVKTDYVPTMIFDSSCEVRLNYDDALLLLMDEVFGPVNLATLFSGDVQH